VIERWLPADPFVQPQAGDLDTRMLPSTAAG